MECFSNSAWKWKLHKLAYLKSDRLTISNRNLAYTTYHLPPFWQSETIRSSGRYDPYSQRPSEAMTPTLDDHRKLPPLSLSALEVCSRRRRTITITRSSSKNKKKILERKLIVKSWRRRHRHRPWSTSVKPNMEKKKK